LREAPARNSFSSLVSSPSGAVCASSPTAAVSIQKRLSKKSFIRFVLNLIPVLLLGVPSGSFGQAELHQHVSLRIVTQLKHMRSHLTEIHLRKTPGRACYVPKHRAISFDNARCFASSYKPASSRANAAAKARLQNIQTH